MLPLAGIRILAVEQYGAGPFGSMQLADMGAEGSRSRTRPRAATSAGLLVRTFSANTTAISSRHSTATSVPSR
jgi:hypothetical protein